jgi:four helix bundle protein
MSDRPPIRTFKDLDEWQQAIELAVRVRDIVRGIPVPERYDFNQTRRAALSVSRNIAEGFGRDHLGDFVHHLSMSRGSVFEVESDLLALRALGLVPDSDLQPVIASADRIGRMLARHSRTLRSKLRGRSNPTTFFDQR